MSDETFDVQSRLTDYLCFDNKYRKWHSSLTSEKCREYFQLKCTHKDNVIFIFISICSANCTQSYSHAHTHKCAKQQQLDVLLFRALFGMMPTDVIIIQSMLPLMYHNEKWHPISTKSCVLLESMFENWKIEQRFSGTDGGFSAFVNVQLPSMH